MTDQAAITPAVIQPIAELDNTWFVARAGAQALQWGAPKYAVITGSRRRFADRSPSGATLTCLSGGKGN